jgi:hypothetical protein
MRSYDYHLYETDVFIIQRDMGSQWRFISPAARTGWRLYRVCTGLQHKRQQTGAGTGSRAEEDAEDEDDEVPTLSNATRETRLEWRRGLHRILCAGGYLFRTHTHTHCHCISPHVPDTHERILRTEIKEEILREGVVEGGGCDECCVCVLVLHCHIEMNIIMRSGVCCTSGSRG